MKQISYRIVALLCLMATSTSCVDYLELESKTDVTSAWLYSSPEGLELATVALYSLDRNIAAANGESVNYAVQMLDFNTDLMVQRQGTADAIWKLQGFDATNSVVSGTWDHWYRIIGKANEIIAAARELGLDNESVLRSYGEACFFRGRAYFELYKRFDRVYLNTEQTTADNVVRVFTPASTEDLFEVICDDLDAAIEALDWELPVGPNGAEYGRATKGAAKHVRAQVAMWQKDWNTAITHCEDIFANTATCEMEPRMSDVFLSGENLRSKEILMAYHFSKNLGGGGSSNNGVLNGHYVNAIVLPSYHRLKVGGKDFLQVDSKYGGNCFGRVYPNSYLLSLYDREKDNRYTEMIGRGDQYVGNIPDNPNFGVSLDMSKVNGTRDYIGSAHPYTKKYFDQWTNTLDPSVKSSFKDLPIYRMGETALMCCEAYFYRDGGASEGALRYYNKTWERAGNEKQTAPLTIDMILDEYARECCFEGVRWALLKRHGLLAERVRAHGGDSKSDDPALDRDYIDVRRNFVEGKHETWPIPQDQIDLMGEENFPQHDSWK